MLWGKELQPFASQQRPQFPVLALVGLRHDAPLVRRGERPAGGFGLHFWVGLLLVNHMFGFLFSAPLFYTKLLSEVVSPIVTHRVPSGSFGN